MSRTVVLVALGVVAVAALPATVAGTQSQVTLEVEVVNQDGDPVSGATLVASWDDGEVTETTRSNGKALVDVPEGADVEIDVQSDTYIRNHPYEVSDASGGDVQVPVSERGSATIEVRDARGQPVDDAVVRLWRGSRYVVNDRTDRDGVYETAAIEQGEYNLVVFKEGFFRNRTTIDVTGPDTAESLSIESGSVTVTVAVTDDRFDPPEPVADASVNVDGVGSVQTLSDGENTIRVPANSRHEVTVTKEGYEEVTETLDVDEEPMTLSATIQRTPGIELAVSNGQVVVGETTRVSVRNEYGEPVSGATVTVDDESVGETDENGELTVTIDDAGERTIAVAADGFSDSATVTGVQPGGETPTETATPADEDEEDIVESITEGPGFTPVVALVALALAAGLLARRR